MVRPIEQRHPDLRRGLLIEGVTVVWMVIEARWRLASALAPGAARTAARRKVVAKIERRWTISTPTSATRLDPARPDWRFRVGSRRDRLLGGPGWLRQSSPSGKWRTCRSGWERAHRRAIAGCP